MFSMTTTALSTSMPTPSISPSMVSTLSSMPSTNIAPQVTSSENGIATATISVVRSAPQEEVQHADGQQPAEDPRVAQAAQRVEDLLALVLPDDDVDPPSSGSRPISSILAISSVDGRSTVFAEASFMHVEADGEIAVEVPAVVEDRLAQAGHVGHVAQTQTGGPDGQLADRLDVAEARQRAHVVAQHVAAHRAEVHVEVGRVDPADHVADVDPVPRAARPGRDRCAPPADRRRRADPGHAADPLQRLADAPVEQVPRLGQVALRGDASAEDLGPGPVGVPLDADVADPRRQERPRTLDGLAHLQQLDVDVHAPVELHLDAGVPGFDQPKIVFTSGIVAISSSIGRTTSRSPSSGWLPGNGTSTSISGSSTTGMKPSGIKATATVPSTVRQTSSITVATGRSSGKSVIPHGRGPCSAGVASARRSARSTVPAPLPRVIAR